MLNIVNSDLQSLIDKLSNKRLIIYGAGERTKFFLENYQLGENVICIIDRNETLQEIFVGENVYSVYRISKMIEIAQKENFVLLVTPAFFSMEIVKELDEIEELNEIDTYILGLVLDKCEQGEFAFSRGKDKIPRKIHYCWFGNGKKNELMESCIASWKEMCPDYEIICWNEKNYDLNKNRYMKQAYEAGRYGFVPDYARLDIIYNEGGIYLDTDVKLLQSLDVLLKDDMYFGLAYKYRSGFGLGFGGVKGNGLIKQLRDYYDDMSFIRADGSYDERPCAVFQDNVLKKYGFMLNNQYEKIGNAVCYPAYVLNPTGINGLEKNFTEKTVSIHYGTSTWIKDKTRKEYVNFRDNIYDRIMLQEKYPNAMSSDM